MPLVGLEGERKRGMPGPEEEASDPPEVDDPEPEDEDEPSPRERERPLAFRLPRLCLPPEASVSEGGGEDAQEGGGAIAAVEERRRFGAEGERWRLREVLETGSWRAAGRGRPGLSGGGFVLGAWRRRWG